VITVQRVAFCPKCGEETIEWHDDWTTVDYDHCLNCHWSNRPSFEEWAAMLRRGYDAGEYDGDQPLKDYVGMTLYDLEHPEE